MSPNSLMGSVAVQGPALAIALFDRFPDVLISETHPKLTTLALGIPLDPTGTRDRRVFEALSIAGPMKQRSDDLVDAIVAAYVAWAAHTKQADWIDLLAPLEDPGLVYPLGKARSVYYFLSRGIRVSE